MSLTVGVEKAYAFHNCGSFQWDSLLVAVAGEIPSISPARAYSRVARLATQPAQ